MRILIGTADIAKYTTHLAKGFRELGYETDTLVYIKSRHYPDQEYTVTDTAFLDGVVWTDNPDGTVSVVPTRALDAFIDRYDAFAFVACSTLLPRMIDLPLLKERGKTVFSRQGGTEVRDAILAQTFFKTYGRRYPYFEQDRETAPVRVENEGAMTGLNRYHAAIANKLHNTRTIEEQADVIICDPQSQTLGIRPYFQCGAIMDPAEFVCRIPARRVPVILHAPTSILYKRTDLIRSALDELEAEGVPFRYVELTGVPHETVRRELTEADIVIDQLSCGAGVFAYEGMACGCAVLSGHDGIASPLPRNRPILNITETNLKESIRRAVLDLPFRVRLAEWGRAFIEAGYTTPAAAAQYLLDAQRRQASGDADLYPVLFTERAVSDGTFIPPYLLERTRTVLERYGTHPDTDLDRLKREGLLPGDLDPEAVPRWDASRLTVEGPWVVTGPNATIGSTAAED